MYGLTQIKAINARYSAMRAEKDARRAARVEKSKRVKASLNRATTKG